MRVDLNTCFLKNISNKSLDLYIELRSNISSLSQDKHIDSRYMLKHSICANALDIPYGSIYFAKTK